MKWSFLLCLMLMGSVAFSQSFPQTKNADEVRRASLMQANDVTVAAPGKQSPAFQARNWKIEAELNPSNASAWLNYYLWTSRDKSINSAEKRQTLQQIFEQANSLVPQSAEAYLIKYLQSGKTDSAALNKALEVSVDKKWLYPYKIQQAVINNDVAMRKIWATQLYKFTPLPGALSEYYYNMLMSADSNGVIYTQALNDMCGLSFVQLVKNHRKDVSIRYYDGVLTPGNNVYLSLTVGGDELKKYPQANYSGLLLKISGSNTTDLAAIVKRFDLKLMFMETEYTYTTFPALYKNYFPSFILFYKHLKAVNSNRLQDFKQLMTRLAEKTGDKQAVEKLMND